MPSVLLQILFFLIAGACILGIVFFGSTREKDRESSRFFLRKANALLTSPNKTDFRAAWEILRTFSRVFFHHSIKQPHEIFVHTRGIVNRFRGERRLSVLDKTFDQDPEKRFSLEDVAPATETDAAPRRVILKQKQAPKLVQKLQNQFEERSGEEKDIKADNEEEFWLGILRQNPHVAHPYKKLGEIYLKRGDYKEAQASLSFALTKDPADKETAALLAEVRGRRVEDKVIAKNSTS